ncbi:leucine--tRNA ligase [Candidatus Saccharibacteria bacterium]|nr:leucine--tRNA ligase [Candidatus Saccharibacteria bacterium]
MERYEPLKIEEKWQKIWEETEPFRVTEKPGVPKMMLAEMFPYPSAIGLHVGHVRNFTIVDVMARFYVQQRMNVMRPFGYDTFGLPAENFAIKTGRSPKDVTAENVANFRKQAKRLGYAIDWSREINTSDPEYYRWTQWCFLQLYKKGLAYRKESYQWWCPVDQTVLANEQVENGKCWRCGHEVEKKKMKQWFFKITEYADELLDEVDALDWPEKIKTMQKNWIGRSVGAEIKFETTGGAPDIVVFTTRPDTIKGATFLVVAPEYADLMALTGEDTRDAVLQYKADAMKKSEVERQENKEKTGVFTGTYAINPATKEKIPVYVADYVLSGYGTGAIMAVPDMDERDREFAEAMGLPVVETELVDRDLYGTPKVMYRMRDWLISRQRYWGCPIPIAYDSEGEPHAIPEEQLPVIIPEVEDYQPDSTGKSALAKAKDWLKVEIFNEKTGKMEIMTRETDTLDGYACSSWYLWRYASPHDTEAAWDPEAIRYWEPVDVYVGGDHAVAHLLYVRFWCKFFADAGYLPFREPIRKLLYNGYINGTDGKKMSKSKGNGVDPLEVINDGYGADTLRTYEMFIGPYDLAATWDPRSVGGVYRFLNRCWNLLGMEHRVDATKTAAVRNKTIKKVTLDIRKAGFNTAVAALMEYVNELYKVGVSQEDLVVLSKLLKPFAPHLASEMLERLGADDEWPKWDEVALTSENIEIVVQINGKMRGKISITSEVARDEDAVVELAKADEKIAKYLESGIKKQIYVPRVKLLNFVV